MRPGFSELVLLTVLANFAGAPLRAQIPDGATVVASFANGFNFRGGLYVVDPTGAAQPITGLPSDLTNANCVLRDPRTGHLISGNLTAGGTVRLYELSVQNLNATVVRSFSLGTARSNGGGVNQAKWLPDGRLIFTVSGIVTDPTRSQSLWILDLQAGTLTAPSLGTWTGQLNLNALAVSPDGRFAYVGAVQILEVPLFPGGTPRIIANMTPYFATSLLFDCSGALVAATTTFPNQYNGRLYWHTKNAAGTWTSTFTNYPAVRILNGAALDPATCDLVLVTGLWGAQAGMATLFRVDPSGTLSTISTGPAMGWGSPSGVDVDPNPEPYGAGTTATSGLAMAWQYPPFPAGAPRLGNLGFQLVPRVSGGTLAYSAALIGPARAQQTLFGLNVLVAPGPAVTTSLHVGPMPVFPVPIPNLPALVGLELHGQAFGIDAALNAASSDGLTFTVLP